MRRYGMARSIDIDFEVHKLIEGERKGFDDLPLAALRRLLGLSSRTVEPSAGRPWIGDGVTLPHGTPVKMRYNRRTYEGQIVDGQWIVEGQVYTTPSGAAVGVARTKKGVPTHLNGWNYWSVKLSGGWVPLKMLQDDARPF